MMKKTSILPNWVNQSIRKIEPFETFISEIVVAVIAIIVTDAILQTILLEEHFTGMMLEVYIHVTTILSAFGILYVYRVSRHLEIIKQVDNFLKSAGIKFKPRIKILSDLINQIDTFLRSYGNPAISSSVLTDLIRQSDAFMTSAPTRPDVAISILKTELREFEQQMISISTEKGGILSSENARVFFESLFKSGSQYFSTDPHVPSRFQISQGWDLEAHQEFQKTHNFQRGKRVLILERDDVIYDYVLNRDKFDSFLTFHKEMNVELKVAVPEKAGLLAANGLKSQEVGIWTDTYCAHYDRLASDNDEDGRVMITLYKKNGDATNYNRCLNYFNDLYEQAEALDTITENINRLKYQEVIELSTPALAQEWDNYVGTWEIDMPPEGVFLLRVLKELNKSKSNISILDAASATGRETIFLSKQGYKMHANSVDRNLDKKLYQNLTSRLTTDEQRRLRRSGYDLRLFDQYFGRRRFDLILLIGNVISRLVEAEERQRIIDQCFKILKPGGILVVDKRNFDKILAHKSEPLTNTYDGFYDHGNYGGKYLYCGQSIRGWPKDINERRVVFEFGNSTDSFGTISMYPLKSEPADELKNLLTNRSFIVDVYEDYDYGKRINQNQNFDYKGSEADFIVYVAHKPQID